MLQLTGRRHGRQPGSARRSSEKAGGMYTAPRAFAYGTEGHAAGSVECTTCEIGGKKKAGGRGIPAATANKAVKAERVRQWREKNKAYVAAQARERRARKKTRE